MVLAQTAAEVVTGARAPVTCQRRRSLGAGRFQRAVPALEPLAGLFPRLKLIIAHGGGAVVLQHNRTRSLFVTAGKDFDAAARTLYWDLAVYEQETMQTMVNVIGVDNLLYASEMWGTANAIDPRLLVTDLMQREELQEILDTLTHRERRVLELRYGLGGEHPRTRDEVGRTFNVTRERIRQIENQSLKKLQSRAEAQKLRDVA